MERSSEENNEKFNKFIKNVLFSKKSIPFWNVALIWFLFENEFIRLFNKHILPLSLKMNFSFITHCLFCIIVILILLHYIYNKCYKNRYFVPWNIILPSSFGIMVYIICRIKYYGSLPWGIVGYSDILILLFAIFIINSIIIRFSKKKKNQTKNEAESIFIPDAAIENLDADKLEYSQSVRHLAKNIENISFENFFSIGLIAPWGGGKSSFLNLLERDLKQTKKFIIINFNPRHSYKAENIQEDFFNILFAELKNYDCRFSSSFKDYLKAINVINDNKFLKFLFNTHKTWDKELEKGKINEAITRIPKRIIVMIEDFDRLLANEIIEIFKLIDGNASFKKMIFITAYDKQHINRIVQKTYPKERAFFSDKFFSLEVLVPLRPYDNIFIFLREQLFSRITFSFTKDVKENKQKLLDQKQLIERYLPTFRDVKRFLNLFFNQYEQISSEVDFFNHFMLYLIKYRYLDEYLKLFAKEYVSTTNIYALNQYYLNKDLKAKSKDVLEILFSDTTQCSLRSINNTMAFDIYFYELIYDHIPMKDLESMFKEVDFEKVKEYIDNSIQNDLSRDVINYMENIDIRKPRDKNWFNRYLDILLYIDNKGYDVSIPYFKILVLLYIHNREEIKGIYLFKDEEYKKLISNKLQGEYPYYPFNLTRGIIMGIINRQFEKEIIFDHKDLLNIAQAALNDLIGHDPKVKQEHIGLLYSCIDDIDQKTREISLNKNSCAKIKQLIEEHPSGYFENFVRLGMITLDPNYNSIACEPYWRQIFGDADSFKTFIDSQTEDTIPNIELIQNFWKLYENNNYKPIEFQNQGNVQEKINRGLVHEVKQLDDLFEIEKEFDNYEDQRKTSQEEDNKTNLSNYEELINRINDIDLYITKTGQIKKRITDTINEIKKS